MTFIDYNLIATFSFFKAYGIEKSFVCNCEILWHTFF